MPGRAMAGYVVLPKPAYLDERIFSKWLDKSVKYASALPPKQKKTNGISLFLIG
jgi:hypothetical protein